MPNDQFDLCPKCGYEVPTGLPCPHCGYDWTEPPKEGEA